LAEQRRAPGRIGLLVVIAGLLLLEASYGVCSQDDAYISFRYAQNLARGLGFVYNPGELVEGYTNFLWTLLFVPTELAGVDPGPVSTAYGYILSVVLLVTAWRMGGRDWRPAALVACFPGLALEAVQGLETMLYAVLVALALEGRKGWWAFAGLAALTRPEGYAVFGILWLFRREKWPLAGFLAMTVPHVAFRLAYYGELLPNTFHAKVGAGEGVAGGALLRGLRYIGEGATSALPIFVAAALGAGLLIIGAQARRSAAPEPESSPWRPALVLIGFFLLYILLVGGDFKGTGRFLIPLLVPMAVLSRALFSRLPPVGRLTVVALGLVWASPGWQSMAAFAERFSADLVDRREAGLRLRELVPHDRWLAVHAAGILPYYAELPTIDMWGLNDAHIARAPVEGLGSGIAGHERADYAYVLGRRPSLILTERDLISPDPLALPDPGVFGPSFLELYAPVSLPMGERYINGWALRPPENDAQ
jgi:hypothetical protein